jgi:C1A family cysteine protease
MNRIYGWRPDVPDFRDLKYKVVKTEELPKSTSWRTLPEFPEIEDQKNVGSCVGHGVSTAMEIVRWGQKMPPLDLSRLFIYYNSRSMEGTVLEDAGAYIRDGIKSVVKQGACRESLWPYAVEKFATEPPMQCYMDALQFQVLEYQRIDNRNIYDIKHALAHGFPIVFGFSVYESFESEVVAKTGIVPMPGKNEKLRGGHCMVAVDYSDNEGRITGPNSWNTTWGDAGYYHMPYDYITNPDLADDFWAITKME